MRRRLFAAVGCVMLFLSFQAIAQVQGKWATTTNNLPSPVQLNTQVLLANGNGDVLVAGGSNGSGYLATAQLYNPVTRLWTATGSMTTARQYFAAVVLPNGRVLVEGGQGTGGAILASAELYTPSTGKWTPAGHMSVARFSHTATLISTASGPKVLVTGGCNTPTCSTATGVSELYDPVLNNWTTTGALHIPRAYQTATRLLNGKVLIVGGVSASSTKSCELYDPTHGTWTVVASTSVLRNQHAAALLASGKVLVAGGNCGRCANFSAEIYDPTLNSWTATGNMTKGRFGHSATTLANNTVLIAAGGTFVGRYYFPTPATEIYDVVTGKFTATGALNQRRMFQTASLLRSGQVMVVGGPDYSGISSTAEVYTPLTLKISPLSLTFGLKQTGHTTAAQTATVTNVSHLPVKFTFPQPIAASGNFAQTNTCPSSPSSPSLAAGASCNISVTFSPTATGTRTGAITLKDNSAGSPSQTIALTGTGEQYAIAFTPSPLNLPAVIPGSSSTASVTVTNDGATLVNISSISIPNANHVFSQTNNCPTKLDVNQTCTIQVVFTPPDSVSYTKTLQIIDSALGSPHLLTLTGTGID